MPITSIFVYGTLQRGESRGAGWPHSPLHVEPARLRGQLYDLGPYPALIEGDDWVAGERWVLDGNDLEPTLRALDAIEGFGQGGDDLYVRRPATCWNDQDESIEVYTYFYADPEQLKRVAQRVTANDQGLCHWRRGEPPRDRPGRPP